MIHQEKIELLKESLFEMIHVSDYSVTYKKTDKNIWGTNATGGILGFPSTVILFSAIDCLGSVFSGNNKYKITIDGHEHTIKNTSQHIYILNSKYFNLELSLIDLSNIYNNIRSTLTHNSLLPEGYNLQPGENEKLPFNIAINENDKRIYFVNVVPLFRATKNAIETFILDINIGQIDFDNSRIHQDIEKRDAKTPIHYDPSKPGQFTIFIKEWIKK